MLKLKDDIPFEELKKYGFKRSADSTNYYVYNPEFEIFIHMFNNVDFKKRHVYIEIKNYSMMLMDLDVLYDLTKDGLVEKVEK